MKEKWYPPSFDEFNKLSQEYEQAHAAFCDAIVDELGALETQSLNNLVAAYVDGMVTQSEFEEKMDQKKLSIVLKAATYTLSGACMRACQSAF